MPKPPPKKREPTLRELLERDAEFPLPTIGITDEFNKTPVENAMSDIQDERTVNSLLARGKQGYADFQRRQVPLGPPSEYNPNVPTPKPISTNAAKLLFDVLTMSSPAGERGDTELARLREANPELAQSRQRMAFLKQVKQGFAPQPLLGNLRDLMGVPRGSKK